MVRIHTFSVSESPRRLALIVENCVSKVRRPFSSTQMSPLVPPLGPRSALVAVRSVDRPRLIMVGGSILHVFGAKTHNLPSELLIFHLLSPLFLHSSKRSRRLSLESSLLYLPLLLLLLLLFLLLLPPPSSSSSSSSFYLPPGERSPAWARRGEESQARWSMAPLPHPSYPSSFSSSSSSPSSAAAETDPACKTRALRRLFVADAN